MAVVDSNEVESFLARVVVGSEEFEKVDRIPAGTILGRDVPRAAGFDDAGEAESGFERTERGGGDVEERGGVAIGLAAEGDEDCFVDRLLAEAADEQILELAPVLARVPAVALRQVILARIREDRDNNALADSLREP